MENLAKLPNSGCLTLSTFGRYCLCWEQLGLMILIFTPLFCKTSHQLYGYILKFLCNWYLWILSNFKCVLKNERICGYCKTKDLINLGNKICVVKTFVFILLFWCNVCYLSFQLKLCIVHPKNTVDGSQAESIVIILW